MSLKRQCGFLIFFELSLCYALNQSWNDQINGKIGMWFGYFNKLSMIWGTITKWLNIIFYPHVVVKFLVCQLFESRQEAIEDIFCDWQSKSHQNVTINIIKLQCCV